MRTMRICSLVACVLNMAVISASGVGVTAVLPHRRSDDAVSLATAIAPAPPPVPVPVPVPVPAPPPPPAFVNVTNVLEQAGQFKTYLSLLGGTQVENQLQTQANNTQQGLTLFAPSDTAFSALRPKTLRKLTDQQKISLVEYHAVPNFYSLGQFQSLSNPISTIASYRFNVTAFGAQVNISTGLVKATITSSIFSQSPVAVYEVDKVLLPEEIFGLPSPSPAPTPDSVSSPASAQSPSEIAAAKSLTPGSAHKPNAADPVSLFGTRDLLLHLLFIVLGMLLP